MRILLVGGGSGGPVAPLLSVADHIKLNHPTAEFLVVGTKYGPERQMVEAAGFKFSAIIAGKWRRYFSWQNFAAPFLVLAGFFQAFKIIANFRPDCVFGTGSFVQVPVAWAAKLKGVSVVLHQQDVVPNLANNLCELAASRITVAFDATVKSFASNIGFFYKKTRQDKIVLTGNPFRENLRKSTRKQGLKFFGLSENFPTLLVLGGGTGSEFLNGLIYDCLPELAKTVQIIHATGAKKMRGPANAQNYQAFEFIDHMGEAYAASDIVLARAGMSTVTELSNLKKFSIIVPLPNSPQEENALYLAYRQAAMVLDQERVSPEGFAGLIRKLLFERDFTEMIKRNIAEIMPKEAARKIAEIIIKLAETSS